jgi:hypothetical protein
MIFGGYSWLNRTSFCTQTITALDQANAEDDILPLPKIHRQEKKRKHGEAKPSVHIEPAINSDISTAWLIEKRGTLSLVLSSLFYNIA